MFPSTTLNVNITKLFCGLHSMLLLLATAAILEISVASQKRRVKLCHLISILAICFVRQVENVRVLIFFSVTPLYSSGGHSNMAAVGFSFPNNRCSVLFYRSVAFTCNNNFVERPVVGHLCACCSTFKVGERNFANRTLSFYLR